MNLNELVFIKELNFMFYEDLDEITHGGKVAMNKYNLQ
jgi:hypothetical protein